jgi:ribosomal protein L24E
MGKSIGKCKWCGLYIKRGEGWWLELQGDEKIHVGCAKKLIRRFYLYRMLMEKHIALHDQYTKMLHKELGAPMDFKKREEMAKKYGLE